MKAKEYSYGSVQVWRKFVARGLFGATFSPDGKLVATGQSGEIGTGQVYLFLGKSRSGQFKDWLAAVALSPSEKCLAATDIAGKALEAHVWSLN